MHTSKDWDNFREVHLWWSGNNAALRAWSEAGSLSSLERLTYIHVHEAKRPLNSNSVTEAYYKEFKDRIEKARSPNLPKINFEYHGAEWSKSDSQPNGHAGKPSPGSERGSHINQYQWLKSMDYFTKGLHDFQEATGLTGRSDDSNPVKVCLVDDGVDCMHPAIAENVMGGKTFLTRDGCHEVPRVPEPYQYSDSNHGTSMALLIRWMCPDAKIFVCKLETVKSNEDGPHFSAESAADALEYAIKQDFDIISLSWTIERNSTEKGSNMKSLDRIKTALHKPASKDTLIFCSAPDVGQAREVGVYWPFDCDEITKKFKIGAANSDGIKAGFAGSSVDFILPGENVLLNENDRVIPGLDDIAQTGSSVATALAAGLAALIIHFVRITAAWAPGTVIGSEIVENIKKHDVMMEALKKRMNIGDKTSEAEQRIAVETFFRKTAEILNNENPTSDTKWNALQDLVRDLVSSKT